MKTIIIAAALSAAFALPALAERAPVEHVPLKAGTPLFAGSVNGCPVIVSSRGHRTKVAFGAGCRLGG